MYFSSKELEVFFDKNSEDKFKLANQTIDFTSLEKKNCELIEYLICCSILESLIQFDEKFQKDLDLLDNHYQNDESISEFIIKIQDEIKNYDLKISNIAVHLTMQKPKLFRQDLGINYKSQMRDYIAETFNLLPERVTIQAGTGEKIGRTGNSESIIIFVNISLNLDHHLVRTRTSHNSLLDLDPPTEGSRGFGFDRHRFEVDPSKKKVITICGQKINYSKSVDAHSDGDVVLHALVNAIFSTIGFGDIGEHFVDTDPEWKNADSKKFVEFAMEKLRENKKTIIKIEVEIIVSPLLYEFIKLNYQNFILDSTIMICNLCEFSNGDCDLSLRLANKNNMDEGCIEGDEGLEARVRVINR